MLKSLPEKNSYIANFICNDPIIKDGIPHEETYYIILEYAPKVEKGDLFDYNFEPEKGFYERHTKVIFEKILNRINYRHKNGICHRNKTRKYFIR